VGDEDDKVGTEEQLSLLQTKSFSPFFKSSYFFLSHFLRTRIVFENKHTMRDGKRSDIEIHKINNTSKKMTVESLNTKNHSEYQWSMGE
jgi:hypothetical protein